MSYRRGLNQLSYEALNAAYPGDGTGAEMRELMKAEMAGTAWELGLNHAWVLGVNLEQGLEGPIRCIGLKVMCRLVVGALERG